MQDQATITAIFGLNKELEGKQDEEVKPMCNKFI